MAQALVMVEMDDQALGIEKIKDHLASVQLGPMGAKQIVLSVGPFGGGSVAFLRIGSNDLEGMGRAIAEFAKVPNARSVMAIKILASGN